jgi:hypothetical protein
MEASEWRSRYIDLEQFERLLDLAEVHRQQAEGCAFAGLYHAACAMEAASVEAALIAQVCTCEPELRDAGAWPTGKGSPLRWTFATLLDVAADGGWLSSPDVRPDLDLPHGLGLARKIRNVAVHPGLHAFEWPELKQLDQQAYRGLRAISDLTFAHLGPVLERLTPK